ncbi:hypothetical protein JM84_1156 [Dokdonia sp. Hel_I_63]|uniref:hypothetical protein n=1 Tax=Dokdonia sp. Hel_I_63 TaxID=1249996 RepID=UPI001199B296|nr:hypothetical protein [Dokdonia sp. Hel_I_63]TVZ22265.1 hypothetical protein JM84_1156 [Dokdonia sp. Hel_I_63]
MTWTINIIGVLLLVALFYYRRHSQRKQRNLQSEKGAIFLENVRANWQKIEINTSNCSVIKYDTQIDKNSPLYQPKHKEESFFDWMNKDNNKVNLVDVARSKFVCNYFQNGELIKSFSKTVDIDITVAQFKLKLRDYVNVYVNNHSILDDYYIDLSFLQEEIDLQKFNN